MKICPKCGASNADSANFCGSCAVPLQQTASRTCPAGKHTMDPGWTECPYCKQDNAPASTPPPSARRSTIVEGEPLPSRSGSPRLTEREDLPSTPRPPRVVPSVAGVPSTAPPTRARAHTEFRSPSTDSASNPGSSGSPAVAKDRKIVGVLVTYSWAPEGRIFPVREGRNFIGRESDCDICIPEDSTMSGRNSHVTFRQNFVVGDMVSMTGTDVDGLPVEEQFRSLPNYATVRAGSTYFTFIAIAPTKSPDAAETAGAGSKTT